MKLSPPAESMINLSIQNFTPFPVQPLFPSRWVFVFFFKGTTEARQDPTGPCQVQKTLRLNFPPFLNCRGEKGLLGPSWVPKSRSKWLMIRTRIRGFQIPPEGKQITILCTSFSSVGTKTPTQDEGGRYMLTTTTETPDWLESDGWESWNITLLHHHQPIRRWSMSWSHSLWLSPLTLSLKTLAWKL